MAVLRHTYTPATIADALIARWQQVPPAIAGDCLNRDNCMNGRIAPISAGLTLTGVARTVTPMAGDNAAIHVMLALADPGDIIVVAGGGNLDIALMGGLMIEAAKARGIGGVIVDGAVRDLAELRASGVPVFAAGACPRGPHKGFGGRIDGAAACGDVKAILDSVRGLKQCAAARSSGATAAGQGPPRPVFAPGGPPGAAARPPPLWILWGPFFTFTRTL